MNETLVLGTRGSELARTQARMVESALCEKWSQVEIETKVIKTSGDAAEIVPVDAHAGRKGLFTGEIERALLNGDVDLAVHSAKDLPSELTSGTEIAAVLSRASTDDVLVSLKSNDWMSLPANGVVATGSVRRRHQLLWKRPDLQVVDLRGNVPTRLKKLTTERWDAVILARAGLERLGLSFSGQSIEFQGATLFGSILPRDVFIPAGGQGIIAVQIRKDDDRTAMLLEAINDFDTGLCLRAERQFLRLLQADCNQPVGVLATIARSTMTIVGQIFESQSALPRTANVEGHYEDAEKLAAELFRKINGE